MAGSRKSPRGLNEDNSGDESEGANSTVPVPQQQSKVDKEKRQEIVKNRSKDICGHCLQKCTSSGPGRFAFQCDYCKYWYHAVCDMGVSEDEFKTFQNNSSDKIFQSIKFYCEFDKCKRISDELEKNLVPTLMKVQANTVKISDLEKQFTELRTEVGTKITSEIKSTTEGMIEDRIKEIWAIEMERAKRSRNVMIKNLPENTGANPTEICKKDVEAASKLFVDELGIDSGDFKIHVAWRIGKPRSDQSPRLLKVILDREYMVGDILTKKKKFLDSSDPTIKSLEMFRDRTEHDRKHYQKLVIEMKEKNSELQNQPDPTTGNPPTNKWIIRGDKLVFVDNDGKPLRV